MRTLAAVFAHPDDETFAVGGTIARYAGEGVTCHLFCATDGGAGGSSEIAVSGPQELALVRRQELHEAARVLGVAGVRPAGHPDGRLGELDQDVLVGEIVDFLREHRPDVVITFGPEGAPNGHRDHRTISRAATAAYFLAGLPTAYPEQLAAGRRPHAPRRLLYVSWLPRPADDPHPLHAVPATVRVDVRAQLDAKRRAFDAHRSQHAHRATFERLGLVPDELYALASGVPQRGPLDDDLFAGL